MIKLGAPCRVRCAWRLGPRAGNPRCPGRRPPVTRVPSQPTRPETGHARFRAHAAQCVIRRECRRCRLTPEVFPRAKGPSRRATARVGPLTHSHRPPVRQRHPPLGYGRPADALPGHESRPPGRQGTLGHPGAGRAVEALDAPSSARRRPPKPRSWPARRTPQSSGRSPGPLQRRQEATEAQQAAHAPATSPQPVRTPPAPPPTPAGPHARAPRPGPAPSSPRAAPSRPSSAVPAPPPPAGDRSHSPARTPRSPGTA